MTKVHFDRPIAHRGLHDRAAGVIENSTSAFERAIEQGFAIECDLQLTRDGVPVVFHDHVLERLTGRKGSVADLTAEEFTRLPLLGSANGDCPQRFSDFLRQVAGRTLLQVELKRQSGPAIGMLAKMTAEALKSYSGPITVESFDPALIVLIRRFGFKGPRGIITHDYRHDDEDTRLSSAQKVFMRHLWHFPWSRFDFVSAHHEALELPAIRFWRAAGKPVTAWTVRSPELARSVAAHCDQIVFEGFTPN